MVLHTCVKFDNKQAKDTGVMGHFTDISSYRAAPDRNIVHLFCVNYTGGSYKLTIH